MKTPYSITGNPTISKSIAELYQVRPSGFEGWADIVLICGPQSVSVMIRSDYGSFDHHWSHCGCDPKEFLIRCKFEYIMKKLCDDYAVLDQQANENDIKRVIIELRQLGCLDKGKAREIWDSMPALAYESSDRNVYGPLIYHHEYFDELYSEYDDIPMNTKPNPRCKALWDHAWLPFIEQLKSELIEQVAE